HLDAAVLIRMDLLPRGPDDDGGLESPDLRNASARGRPERNVERDHLEVILVGARLALGRRSVAGHPDDDVAAVESAVRAAGELDDVPWPGGDQVRGEVPALATQVEGLRTHSSLVARIVRAVLRALV